jgi:hypothetical protein
MAFQTSGPQLSGLIGAQFAPRHQQGYGGPFRPRQYRRLARRMGIPRGQRAGASVGALADMIRSRAMGGAAPGRLGGALGGLFQGLGGVQPTQQPAPMPAPYVQPAPMGPDPSYNVSVQTAGGPAMSQDVFGTPLAGGGFGYGAGSMPEPLVQPPTQQQDPLDPFGIGMGNAPIQGLGGGPF